MYRFNSSTHTETLVSSFVSQILHYPTTILVVLQKRRRQSARMCLNTDPSPKPHLNRNNHSFNITAHTCSARVCLYNDHLAKPHLSRNKHSLNVCTHHCGVNSFNNKGFRQQICFDVCRVISD